MFTELSFSERKRHVLLGAAQTSLRRFSQATMDRVAQAGVSKRTVYKHFRSKQELFNVVVDGIWTRITAWSVEWMNPEGDPRTEFGLALKIEQLWHPDVLPILRMAAAEFMQRPDLGRNFTSGRKLWS